MAKSSKRKIRVLVIDDSATVRIAATRIFGNQFDVLLAVDGEDGLEVIENDPNIQVIFTDLVMPEMDGFELLKTLRTHKVERINNLPVIVMTSAENPEIAKQKAIAMGATDFITKPFTPADIRARAQSYAQLNLTTEVLKKQTTIDELTGTLNKRGLLAQLEKEVAFVTRHKYPMSIMSIEIDNYKDLFISIGRNNSESVIRRTGQLLKNILRKEDTISRTGLAKFSVTMPLVIKENAMEVANKICQNVESFKAKLNGKRLPLTVSAGIIAFEPSEEIMSDDIFEMTDAALTKAKSLGASQLYVLTNLEYQQQIHKNGKNFSIDHLLEQLEEGNELVVAKNLDSAIERLAPLYNLLSNRQKQRLLSYGARAITLKGI